MQNSRDITVRLEILVQRWIASFNAHDVMTLVALYAEHAELFDSGMKRTRRGRAQIEHWFRQRFATMPTIQYTPTSAVLSHSSDDEEGTEGRDGMEEQAAVTWTAQGITPALFGQSWLARPFQVNGVSVFTVKEDLILRQHGYYDHLSVVQQVLPPLRWLLPVRL